MWALGDQAAVIPSFTGDGMSIALHSGCLAAAMYLQRGDGRAISGAAARGGFRAGGVGDDGLAGAGVAAFAKGVGGGGWALAGGVAGGRGENADRGSGPARVGYPPSPPLSRFSLQSIHSRAVRWQSTLSFARKVFHSGRLRVTVPIRSCLLCRSFFGGYVFVGCKVFH